MPPNTRGPLDHARQRGCLTPGQPAGILLRADRFFKSATFFAGHTHYYDYDLLNGHEYITVGSAGRGHPALPRAPARDLRGLAGQRLRLGDRASE